MHVRRILVVAIGATLVLGVGAAWAGPGRGDPVKREAAKACLAEAKAANPDADRAALRAAVTPCLEAAGITPGSHPVIDGLRDCMAAAREANADAEREVLREALRACVAESGVPLRGLRDRVSQCREEVAAANPDANGETRRPLVRECVAKG